MNRNSQLAQALGQGLGSGLNAYLDTTKYLEERDRQRALQDEERRQRDADRERKMTLEDFEVGRAMLPGMLQAGQNEAAVAMTNQQMARMRAAGFNVPNTQIVGGIKQTPARLDPTPMGGAYSPTAAPVPAYQSPMADLLGARGLLDAPLHAPDMSFGDAMTQGLNAGPEIGNLAPLAPETVTERNFGDKRTLDTVRGLYGLQTPQPQSFELGPGQSRYSVGPDGKPQLQVTAPIPDNPYKMRADVQEELRRLGYSEASARQQAGIQAANDRQQVGIAATNARQQAALGAADAKTFTASVNALAAQFPGIQVTSGQRSNAEQQALWEKDLASNGGKPTGRVARPGHSAHETGLARDVYVPPAQRAAFIATARAQGFYVKDDYPDGHIHIAVPQGVRPAAPPAAAKPKSPPKPFDEKEAWAIAKQRFPDGAMGGASAPTMQKREAYVEQKRKEHAAAVRKAAGPDEFDQWVSKKMGGK